MTFQNAVPRPNLPNQPPVYKMSLAVDNVKDLWREWKEGLACGPSVENLERQWGTAWRKNKSASRFFQRRKKIIDKVVELQESKSYSAAQATEYLDRFREEKGTHGIPISLSKLYELINSGEI